MGRRMIAMLSAITMASQTPAVESSMPLLAALNMDMRMLMIVNVHYSLEDADNLVALHARNLTYHRRGRLRRDQGDLPAHPDSQILRQITADNHDILAAEAVQATGQHMIGDGRTRLDVFGTNAANGDAGRTPLAGHHHLALDDGIGGFHHGHAAHGLGQHLIVGKRPLARLDGEVTVEAQDLREHFMAEPVHDGHDDDQGCDAQHDAEERENGDDGDEAFLAPRAQVAHGYQPFEGREHETQAANLSR